MELKGKMQKKKQDLTVQYQDRGKQLAGRLDIARQKYGWLDILYLSTQGFFDNKMTLHAGNFAYSAFLGLFPLLLFVLSIVGYLFHYDPDTMQRVVNAIKGALPDMQTTVQNAGDSMARLRGTVGIIGLIGLLWSMSRITYSFQLGFEAAWGMKHRGYVAKKAYSVTLMLLLMVVAVTGLSVTFITTHLFSWVNQHTGPVISSMMVVASHIVSPCATMFIFAMLYRTIPRDKPGWREILIAAIPMALLLDLLEYGLGIYFTKISKTQALYGSLGVTVGIVLWLYFVGVFIFFGAEIVQTMQKRNAPAPITIDSGTMIVPRDQAEIAPESDEAPDE
jgi:membrane protein